MRRLLALAAVLVCAGSAFCADIVSIEREAMIMRVELNTLGSSGDPLEREAWLRKIIDKCKGTEEAEAAYWDLASLYLDGFPEEKRQEAREMLELCLRSYPNTRRSLLVKCRLVDLYEEKDSRRAELVSQLRKDSRLPSMMRNSLN